jgi:hypothetical protein
MRSIYSRFPVNDKLFANGSDVQPGALELLKQRYRKRDQRDQQSGPG